MFIVDGIKKMIKLRRSDISISRSYGAEKEIGGCCSYKHPAPTELVQKLIPETSSDY